MRNTSKRGWSGLISISILEIALLLKPDLLIVDDFALKEFARTQAEDLYELMGQGYRCGSMIVTANRSPEDWYTLLLL